MKVGLWAEIRRLAEIEKLSARVIARPFTVPGARSLERRKRAASRTLRSQPRQPLGSV